jgi:predicted MPP superfamily phosphohydrolase
MGVVAVTGIHDETGAGAPDVTTALGGADRAGFALLAAHQPLSAERAQGLGIDLQVSGHTHGGSCGRFAGPCSSNSRLSTGSPRSATSWS